MNKDYNISVISAASGAGKTTVVNRLLQTNQKCVRAITHTTRQMRPGETNGIDYHFVDKEKFEKMIDEGALIEWAKVYENYYGTSKKSVELIVGQNKRAILVIEWQGALSIKKIYPNAQFILLVPPSPQELEKRLFSRGGDADDIAKRISLANDELKQMLWYDQVLVNDDLNASVKQLELMLDDRSLNTMTSQQPIIDRFLNKSNSMKA